MNTVDRVGAAEENVLNSVTALRVSVRKFGEGSTSNMKCGVWVRALWIGGAWEELTVEGERRFGVHAGGSRGA